ncbi:MAG: outer membrane beta-barrel protein [Alphaproteobacteria bacterium]
MKKQILLVAVSVLALTTTANANYVTGSFDVGGVMNASTQDQLESSSNFNIGFGARINKRIRAEGSFSHRSSETNEAQMIYHSGLTELADLQYTREVTNNIIFGTMFYDFENEGKLKPFVGIGFGFGTSDTKISNFESEIGNVYWTLEGEADETFLAYRGIFGIGYEINKNTTLDFSYELLGASSSSGNSFNVGLRYNF